MEITKLFRGIIDMVVSAPTTGVALSTSVPREAHGFRGFNFRKREGWLFIIADLLLQRLTSDCGHVTESLE